MTLTDSGTSARATCGAGERRGSRRPATAVTGAWVLGPGPVRQWNFVASPLRPVGGDPRRSSNERERRTVAADTRSIERTPTTSSEPLPRASASGRARFQNEAAQVITQGDAM